MKYIVASDIHLGHKRTPTKHIIQNLKEFLLSKSNKNVNVIFLAGDVFDRLLDLNSEEVHDIIIFFNHLLEYCYENSIILRVLEGTPSHDWCQSYLLVKLNEIRKHKVNLKYFRVLDIEYIEQYNKYILYIPDEWVNDHKELEKQIENKLLENNISKVDIAILHGQFEYQVKGYKNVFFFKEGYFLDKVKEFIHVGHHHVFSQYLRIIANGSFDRLAFGEENKKGFVLVDNDSYEFIENKKAYVYKTYLIERDSDLNKLDKEIRKLPKDSYVRIQINENVNIDSNAIKIKYLDYNIKIQKLFNETNLNEINEDNNIELNVFNIDNLKDYLENNIRSKNTLDKISETILNQYLNKFFSNNENIEI